MKPTLFPCFVPLYEEIYGVILNPEKVNRSKGLSSHTNQIDCRPSYKLIVMVFFFFLQIFTLEEEKALKTHIIKMSKLFYGLDKWKVRKLAFEFAKLKKKKVPNSWHARKIAGEDWLKGFRKRMGSLSLRTPESTSLARAMAFNRFNVNSFFDNLKSAIDNFHPPATRIWNLNETGINTVPKSRQILCKTGTRQVGQIRSGERGVNVTIYVVVSVLQEWLYHLHLYSQEFGLQARCCVVHLLGVLVWPIHLDG